MGPCRVYTAACGRSGPCNARDPHVLGCGSETRSGNASGGCSLSCGRTKARLGRWIWTGWVLYADGCVKLYVACAVCSVHRVHCAGYGRAEHICSRGEPLGLRGLLLGMRRVTAWLHVWSGSGRRELNPCRMVPSMRDEVHVQLHDVTGKVQSARAASCRAGAAR